MQCMQSGEKQEDYERKMKKELPNHLKLTKKEESEINKFLNRVREPFIEGVIVGILLFITLYLISL